jgi:hypothetical protein
VKDAKRYEHTALEGLGQHLGHDFAVAWRHSCQQHADATPRTVRRLASAGFPPPGPGPVGADLALALAALADESSIKDRYSCRPSSGMQTSMTSQAQIHL